MGQPARGQLKKCSVNIFSDRASRRVGLLKLNKYKYFISTFNTETPLKPSHCGTERKENVWDTFLAIGPAGALGFIKFKAQTLKLKRKQISSLRDRA
jgi:hypothetical protein